jgi:hypothetical protein
MSMLQLIHGASAQEFSAETVASDPAGKVLNGKLYQARGKMRFESSNGDFTLVDLDAKTGYVFDAKHKVYVERALSRLNSLVAIHASSNPCEVNPASKDASTATCKMTGREIVNGRNIEKYEATVAMGGDAAIIHFWVDPSLHVIIKYEMNGKTISELRNVQEGPQPKTLFEIPAGYQKMAVLGR